MIPKPILYHHIFLPRTLTQPNVLLLPLLKTRPNTKFLKPNLTELPRSLRLNKPCTMNSNVTLPNFQASSKLLPNRPKPDLLNECFRFYNNTGCFSRSWDSSYWKYGSK